MVIPTPTLFGPAVPLKSILFPGALHIDPFPDDPRADLHRLGKQRSKVHVEGAPSHPQVLQRLGVGKIRSVGHLERVGAEETQASVDYARATGIRRAAARMPWIPSTCGGAVEAETTRSPAISGHMRAQKVDRCGSEQTPMALT